MNISSSGDISTADIFRRGFLLWPDSDLPPQLSKYCSGWKVRPIADYFIFYDEQVEFRQEAAQNCSVAVLGSLMDVANPQHTPNKICSVLVEKLIEDMDSQDSSGAYPRTADAMKTMAGSHIYFFACRDKIFVSLDATGTFPCCFADVDGQSILSSHPTMLGAVLGKPISEFAQHWMKHPMFGAGGRYMPGMLTVHDGVRIIIANHFFDLKSQEFFRFFPDRDFMERDIDRILSTCIPKLTMQFLKLSQDHKLAIGLSGGLDSRLTFALSKDILPEALYFTYFSESNHILSKDMEVAESLQKRFGFNHNAFKTGSPGGKLSKENALAWELSTGGVQGPPGLTRQFKLNLGDQFLHIRSNVLEIVRGFYSKNPVNQKNEFNAHKLSRLFRRATADEFEIYFEEFIEKTDFKTENFRGFHYTDMFYWEHRMSAWLGPMIRGNRLALDTWIIYNCRFILEQMISRPMKERNEANIVRAMIVETMPEALEIPIFSGAHFINLSSARDD